MKLVKSLETIFDYKMKQTYNGNSEEDVLCSS